MKHKSILLLAAKAVLTLTTCVLICWIAPWLYHFATDRTHRTPFTLYSSVTGEFASIVHENGQNSYIGQSGQRYTEAQFDSILPMFYYRQLIADERLPDTLFGQAINPRTIQTENFIFRTMPAEVNKKTIPLYPLLESMSGRVDLEMPSDVFRITGKGIEFIDMESNRTDTAKSRLFTDALLKKGFRFPAQIVSGNGTTRKEYDNGYLLTDSSHELYNLRMVQGRPYVRKIEMPDGVIPEHMFVTEFRNRRWIGFIADNRQRFWVLETGTYQFRQVELPPFSPANTSMTIIGNMFDWTVILENQEGGMLIAIDAGNLQQIRTMEIAQPELTVAERIGEKIPQLRFLSPLDKRVFPYFD